MVLQILDWGTCQIRTVFWLVSTLLNVTDEPILFVQHCLGAPLHWGSGANRHPGWQHCPYCQRRLACWTKRRTTPHYYSSWRLYTSATLIASWSTEMRASPFQNTDNRSWTMLHGSYSTLRKMRKLPQHEKYPSIQNAWRPKHYK